MRAGADAAAVLTNRTSTGSQRKQNMTRALWTWLVCDYKVTNFVGLWGGSMLIYKTEEGDTGIQSSQERLCQMLAIPEIIISGISEFVIS
jgi:hypothetical protein